MSTKFLNRKVSLHCTMTANTLVRQSHAPTGLVMIRDIAFAFACVLSLVSCKEASESDQIFEGPHALASIQIREAHESAGGTANASVAISFIPDADAQGEQCTRSVAGCEIPLKADCAGACGTSQVCDFNKSCEAECVQSCDASCDASEECYFPTESEAACRAIQSFDGGTIALLGTTTPVTLFPPYSFSGVDEGSLFLDGDEIQVRATGATAAGYDALEESFSATRLLRTSPALHELSLNEVFGTGDIPIGWLAGEDEVTIVASVGGKQGESGTITCQAEDASGSYALPREAISAVLDQGVLQRLSISVTRTKTKVTTGLGTHGELVGEVLQSNGWLELSTQSTEYAAFEGCQASEGMCDNACIDILYDAQNCGGCGLECSGAATCENGTCSGAESCNSCVTQVETGVCANATNTCQDNVACSSLKSCLGACPSQTCVDSCFEEFPDGHADHGSWAICICNVGCSAECAAVCQ